MSEYRGKRQQASRGQARVAVMLVNLGTPDSPAASDVRSYLRQFLNDPRVIDIPWLTRKLLVNLIIVPFRAPKSAKIYKELWTDEGSPILFHGYTLRDLLQQALGDTHKVYLAMRYRNPSIGSTLEEIRKKGFSRILVLPLFPHYASATTGSVYQEVTRIVRTWWVIPEITLVGQYYNNPAFIRAWVMRGMAYDPAKYDHVVFSYHGLPLRQVEKTHGNQPCESYHCKDEINSNNAYCYQATCYATTRLLVSGLKIADKQYTVSFQSRLDDKWLKPFTDEVIVNLAKQGIRRVLVFSPAFTADCLETIIEIGVEYRTLFEKEGGEELQMVLSLNDHPEWVACLRDIVRGYEREEVT